MSDKVNAAHLLVKHSGSRRPASWKESNITRSKDEALNILEGCAALAARCRSPPPHVPCSFKAQIIAKAGGDPAKLKAAFMELARTQSDCNSHSQGGELGFFGPGEMQWFVARGAACC